MPGGADRGRRRNTIVRRTGTSRGLAASRWQRCSGAPELAFDTAVPPWVVGGCLLAGLIAFSGVGCYAYYPPPQEIFEELRIAKGEALSAAMSGEEEHALQWIEICDDWTRKLQVGVYLRRGKLSAYHRMKAYVVREKLEVLEHEVKDRDMAEIQRLATDVNRAFTRLRIAFEEDL